MSERKGWREVQENNNSSQSAEGVFGGGHVGKSIEDSICLHDTGADKLAAAAA
jgi:hypothetical protein